MRFVGTAQTYHFVPKMVVWAAPISTKLKLKGIGTGINHLFWLQTLTQKKASGLSLVITRESPAWIPSFALQSSLLLFEKSLPARPSSVPRLNPSRLLLNAEAGSVVSHAKEAECHGFKARPTLASEAMPRWGMANVGETHFPRELSISSSFLFS